MPERSHRNSMLVFCAAAQPESSPSLCLADAVSVRVSAWHTNTASDTYGSTV
jgi:hypothetical protein